MTIVQVKDNKDMNEGYDKRDSLKRTKGPHRR